MTNTTSTPGDASDYEIRIHGHLDDRWSAWFDGLEIAAQPDGTTVIDRAGDRPGRPPRAAPPGP